MLTRNIYLKQNNLFFWKVTLLWRVRKYLQSTLTLVFSYLRIGVRNLYVARKTSVYIVLCFTYYGYSEASWIVIFEENCHLKKLYL